MTDKGLTSVLSGPRPDRKKLVSGVAPDTTVVGAGSHVCP